MAGVPLTKLQILAEVASYQLDSSFKRTKIIKEPRSCTPHQINSYELETLKSAGTVVKTPLLDEKCSSLERSASCSGFLQGVSSMDVRIPEFHDYTESPGSDIDSVKKMLTFTNMDVIDNSALEKDHDYLKGKCLEVSSLTVSTIVPNIVDPQFIIETPAFPYVHGAASFHLTGIEELNADGTPVNPKHQYQGCKTHPDLSEAKKDILGTGKKFPRSSRKQNVTGSVLECMENQAKFKSSGTFRVPKNPEVLNDNNSENLENLQKIEKELALKLIADTRAQKKPHKGSLKCKICQDKQFTAQATLIHHYRSHAGMKLHICKICDHRFTRQHSLKYHMLIHENRSRFHCSMPSCGRTFRHPSHFKDHVRNHTGETPYECSDCHTHFKTRNTYKRHLRVRHKKLLTAKGNIEDIKTN